MARPVSYNINIKKLENDISMADMPDGHRGEGFFATSFGKVIGLARKNSIWPLPFATSCCGIEFMATMGSHYDRAKGSAVLKASTQLVVIDVESNGQVVFRHEGPPFAGKLTAETIYAGDVAWVCAPGYVKTIDFGDSRFHFDQTQQAFVTDAKNGLPVTGITLKNLTKFLIVAKKIWIPG
jgi:hypothetical protein